MGPGEVELFVVGAVVSGVIGYFTVKYFIRYLASHSLRPFAWYRLALASSVLIWWLCGVTVWKVRARVGRTPVVAASELRHRLLRDRAAHHQPPRAGVGVPR